MDKTKLSVCMITKNEEKNLKRCLSSIREYPFEIIVVDTGSQDETVKVAKQFTEHVFSFPWMDDFSAAKNYAVSKATHDMVMILDSDEYFLELDVDRVFSLIEKNPGRVGRIRRINRFEQGDEIVEYVDDTNRIFDRTIFHFEGSIHEQVVRKNSLETYEMYDSEVKIGHEGYHLTPEKKKEKAYRNLKLLLKEIVVHPEDTYLLYQIGKAYFMAGEKGEAIAYFGKAFQYEVNPNLDYVKDMVETYAYSLLDTKQYEKALELRGIYDTFSDRADFCFVMGLIYMNNALFEEAVQEFLHCSTFLESKIVGVNSYKAFYNVGVILECLGKKEEALLYYKKCGDYQKALVRRNELERKST